MTQEATRIAVLVPAGNVVHEREFRRLQPAGVAFRFVDFSYPPSGERFCADLCTTLGPLLDGLRTWGAELVLLGCTTAAMTCDGPAFLEVLESRAGVPVVTAATASREALRALGVKRACVATPYGDLNNTIVSDFLAASGVAVEGLEGLGLDRSVESWVAGQPSLTPQRVLDLSLAADSDAAEGLYLPCTGMGSLEAIAAFEQATGKPATSSVQAGFWASLRRLGLDGRRPDMGRLLATWDAPVANPPYRPTPAAGLRRPTA